MTKEIIYSDLNQDFPTKQPLVTNLEAVIQSIKNLLLTSKTQRVMRVEYFSEIEDLLFEPMTDDMAFILFDSITNLIHQYEPRVKLKYSECFVTPHYDIHVYEVFLKFRVIGLEQDNFQSLNLYLSKLADRQSQ